MKLIHTPSAVCWVLILMLMWGASWCWGQATQPASASGGGGGVQSPKSKVQGHEEVSGGASGNSGGGTLAIRQERVQRMMSDLEEKLIRLAKNLETTEPERSRRLVEAIQQSRQTMIENRMATIVRLLNQEKLDPAGKEQGRIMADLKKLVDLLMKDDQDKIQDQIRQFERWSKELHRLVQEEMRQRDQSLQLAEKDRVLQAMQQQLQALGQLIQRQQELNHQTDQARQKGAQELPPLADQQKNLHQDTKQLASEVGKLLPSLLPTPEDSSPASSDSTPGQQALNQASEHQKAAQDDLGQAKGKSASQQQSQALDRLKQAMQELEKKKQQVAAMSPEQFPAMQQQQETTADQTDQLAKEMSQASSASESDAVPGQDQVQQARQQMQQAQAQLQQRSAKPAAGKQQEAVNQLQQAKKQVDKKLSQLKQEAQEEVMAELEARFRRMLLQQQPITVATVKLDQIPTDRWDRAQYLQCAKQAGEQERVAQMAQEALGILNADGSTVVFVRIVAQLRDDTQTAHQWLKQELTGSHTQQLHRDIERTLEELLDALKQAKEQGSGASKPPANNANPAAGQPPPPPPLVPGSAELKLLKAAQLRVNHRTLQFEQQRPADLNPTLKREVRRIAQWQEEVRKMAQDLAKRK